jgi:NADH-quinone oxidoreductase subunit C
MKSLVNSSFRQKTYFIENTDATIVGTISMDSTVNLGGELFFRSKVEGFRILEKWSLIQRFPSIKLSHSHSDEVSSCSDELTITTPIYSLIQMLTFLKKFTLCCYEQLRDISAIDHVESDLRFEVVYQLLSVTNCKRLSVTVFVSEGGSVQSSTGLYSSAGWYERETWDRFGVFFHNHSDLRRILTDYGFKGHPLRKDFPVTGFVEVRYNADTKSIAYEKVSLAQASRETVSSL